METHFKFKFQKFCVTFLSYIHITTLAVFAQSTPPEGIKIPPNAPGRVEETIPQPSPNLPITPPTETVPILPSSPQDNLPDTSFPSSQSFFVKEIKVKGNSVLNDEIIQLKQVLENKKITFEQLLQLRTEITQLYAKEGYISSGAFIPINQDIANGVVQIQIVEGELEDIIISGLKRLQKIYVRSRIKRFAGKPLNPHSALQVETQINYSEDKNKKSG